MRRQLQGWQASVSSAPTLLAAQCRTRQADRGAPKRQTPTPAGNKVRHLLRTLIETESLMVSRMLHIRSDGTIRRARMRKNVPTFLGLTVLGPAFALVLAGGLDPDQFTSNRADRLVVQQLQTAFRASAWSADFREQFASEQARQLADWIADSADNHGSAFFVVDKKLARIHVFDKDARLLGSSAVLLGAAIGDDSIPGIGNRPVSMVMPDERTTSAGRFVAEAGRNLHNEDILWLDYDVAVSLHRVRTSNPKERRLERLASESIEANRIPFGCINVPIEFRASYLRPTIAKYNMIVYVLPEKKSLAEVFSDYKVRADRPSPSDRLYSWK